MVVSLQIIYLPQPAQSDPESPDHDADDYEEMEQAMKRDSFQDDGPEDIYQNQ